MEWNAKWIRPEQDMGDVVPLFFRDFKADESVASAVLSITAIGDYRAAINGKRVGSFILAPGWTAFKKRLQVQKYDVTDLLSSDGDNRLEVLVGKGWYRSRLPGWTGSTKQDKFRENPAGLTAELILTSADGKVRKITTDETWSVSESPVRFSEIYDGEIYDATFQAGEAKQAVVFDGPTGTLIPQQGEKIIEQERIGVCRIFTTPVGEKIIDFGQELTGYLEVSLEDAAEGEVVDLSFAEVLDQDGNFYTENYRTAKAQYHYICKKGNQIYKPLLTFFGFRYVRVNAFPGGTDKITSGSFTAIQLNSEMARTGYIRTSDPMLNQLVSNIIWGQKCNFVDVPTDCPQRDERLGWTGDAQAFIRTACYNFDTEKFYTKWLADLAADQRADGAVGFVIPDILEAELPSAAWGDAGVICPWELYRAYGNKKILADQFDSMRRWVDYITSATKDVGLWTGGEHFGDWLGLDAPSGSYKGSSREDLIASAFYAYSTELLIKAGHALKQDMTSYETLLGEIKEAYRRRFPEYHTQTECVLSLYFDLAENPGETARQLADMVRRGGHLMTGFVGTPYLLHVLADYGYTDLAWSLLLRKEYPGWLYPITKGATTMWEHWDGIKEDGNFWSADMNSFNHYAYGAVADWMYGVAAGIAPALPGYEKAIIAPHPTDEVAWFEAEVHTRHGIIRSSWCKTNGDLTACKKKDRKAGTHPFRFDIETPVETEVIIGSGRRTVQPGKYMFFGRS